MYRYHPLHCAFVLCIALLLCPVVSTATASPQVLALVGGQEITSDQLQQAMNSAPFATQFPTMELEQQARLRGDMLLRLVNAELLYQEALAQGLDRSPDFRREMTNFRTGLLAQRYEYGLRDDIQIPADVETRLRETYKGEGDALEAARSTYIASRYKALKAQRMAELRDRYHLRLHMDRLRGEPGPDTVLAEGDGFKVYYRDISGLGSPEAPAEERKQVEDIAALLLKARAARDEGIDIGTQMDHFRRRLLAKLLMDQKEAEWVPDETTLRDYFQRHPEIGHVPEVRQIGQLVVADRQQAEALRKRILAGESLFVLAGEYSIDPYGREHLGDMGWLKEGTGMPQIEAALKGLADDELSEVIETPRGYHLVMIIGRKPGEQRPFGAVRDQVRRAIIEERLPPYIQALAARHPVEWRMADHRSGSESSPSP